MRALSSIERVQAALDAFGLEARVVTLPGSTRTAKEAAESVGCSVAQIAKSLVFRATASDRPVLAVMSGSNRVDVAKLANAVGEPVGKADAGFVRRRTGFAIGGVPPVGHDEELLIVLDEDLFRHRVIWAAAGGPFSVFELTPEALERVTGASRINLREDS